MSGRSIKEKAHHMLIPKTIMAACDGSHRVFDVFSYAADLAQKCRAQLLAVHIIDERNVAAVQRAFGHLPHPEQEEWDNYVKGLIQDASTDLEALIRKHRHDRLSVVKFVQIGNVGEKLLTLISEKHVDLVVVGNSHRHPLCGHLLGGTLHRLFGSCPVPLISVRSSMHLKSAMNRARNESDPFTEKWITESIK
jgi:nucleotide-binding universal stress UspA family protein